MVFALEHPAQGCDSDLGTGTLPMVGAFGRGPAWLVMFATTAPVIPSLRGIPRRNRYGGGGRYRFAGDASFLGMTTWGRPCRRCRRPRADRAVSGRITCMGGVHTQM